MLITATLGPASLSDDTIKKMSKKCNAFRLNSAHIKASELRTILKKLHDIYKEQEKELPVVLDLHGAKVRIGLIPPADKMPERVNLFVGEKSDDVSLIPVTNLFFFNALNIGDRLFINDAKIELEVVSRNKTNVELITIKNGPISSFKSINRKEHPVPFLTFQEADLETIGLSVKYDFIQYAVSFVHNGEEAKFYRPMIGNKKLIAKIERSEAMPFIPTIERFFDELWFCRGDMGAQAGLAKLGPLQNEFIEKLKTSNKIKLLAGQVLEHMTLNNEPTRSEVVHLYDIQKAGFDGIVLSDETAIGKNPINVLDTITELSRSF